MSGYISWLNNDAGNFAVLHLEKDRGKGASEFHIADFQATISPEFSLYQGGITKDLLNDCLGFARVNFINFESTATYRPFGFITGRFGRTSPGMIVPGFVPG